MKIRIITCHDVYNYGASLQAYALMTHLNNLGHDAKIIDYRPKYLTGPFKFCSVNSGFWQKNIFLKIIYIILKLPERFVQFPRKRAFDRFTHNRLTLTENSYLSNEELKLIPPKADVYICGSDQIWNCNLPNGHDPAFYLDFAPDSSKKISYAASFAMDYIPDGMKTNLKERINKIDHISVREAVAVNLLQDIGINRGVKVLDPVFLLDRKDWEGMAKFVSKEKYVLMYNFDNEKVIYDIARNIANDNNYKIYSVNFKSMQNVDKNIKYASPEEFIGLVKNASYVVTNSYHAIVFSIIFNVEFVALGRLEKLNSRIVDILESVGLEDRYLTNTTNTDVWFPPIDYCEVEKKIDVRRQESKQFITNSLS